LAQGTEQPAVVVSFDASSVNEPVWRWFVPLTVMLAFSVYGPNAVNRKVLGRDEDAGAARSEGERVRPVEPAGPRQVEGAGRYHVEARLVHRGLPPVGRRGGAPRAAVASGIVGYMTQAPALYADLSVEENLRFFAALEGVADAGARMRGLLASGRSPRPAGARS